MINGFIIEYLNEDKFWEGNMKKVAVLVLCFVMLCISGCDFSSIYDDDAKIAGSGDSSSTSMSSRTVIGNDYKWKVKMTGMQTIWRYNAENDGSVSISYMLSVTEGGKAKLVLITPDNEVVILIENTDNSVYSELQTQNISVKQGVNRIKIVGYESPKIEFEMNAETGRFITE